MIARHRYPGGNRTDGRVVVLGRDGKASEGGVGLVFDTTLQSSIRKSHSGVIFGNERSFGLMKIVYSGVI